MFVEIFSIIAPVFLCSAIGLGWAKLGVPYETNFVTRLVTHIGFPCLIFAALIKVDITPESMGIMGLASIATVVAFAVIATPLLLLFKLKLRTFLPAMMFANTGNMGLPLCLLAFGETGLALGISYFAVNLLIIVTFGPAIAAGNASPTQVLKIPLLWVTVAALLCKFAHIPIPGWLFKTVDLVGGMTIPLMLITLGVSLAQLRVSSLQRSLWLSVLRLSMGFFVGWVTAELMGYEGVAKGVLIIECAMPVAVFNYLFAQLHNTQPEEVAGTVLISTVLSFITLPALMWYVV
ncbi:AEC family transporter [Pseudomonadota bacterium]